MRSSKNRIECWCLLDLNEKGSLWHSLNLDAFYETKKEAEKDIEGCAIPSRWKPVEIRIDLKKKRVGRSAEETGE